MISIPFRFQDLQEALHALNLIHTIEYVILIVSFSNLIGLVVGWENGIEVSILHEFWKRSIKLAPGEGIKGHFKYLDILFCNL